MHNGAAGKDFVSEVARLLQAYADESSLDYIAMKACMVMQVILLQKPSPRSKAKDHAVCLKRCLQMWRNEDIEELYKECKCLQARMSGSHPAVDSEQISRTFSRLMMLGKTKSALQYLFRKADEGVLKLDDHIPFTNGDRLRTVREVLQELHPTGKDPDPESLLSSSYQSSLPTDPNLFEALDGALIQQVGRLCKGSAGLTGLDAHAWKRMCTAFKQASWDLCSSIANVS